MKELEVVMVRLASDPDFRAKFDQDPDTVFAANRLTESERRLLLYIRPLLALTPQALLARWVPDTIPDGPIWWDSMGAPQNYGV